MNKFRLIFMALALTLLSPLVSEAQLSGDSWKETQAKKQGNLTILYYKTPAFIFKNEQGEMQGVCAEILSDFQQYVKEKYGVNLAYTYKESERKFSAFLNEVKASDAGVIGVGNVSVTEERKKEMKFTNSYFRNLSVLLTHKSTPRLSQIDDFSEHFKGYKAVIVKGSTYEQLIEEIKEKYMPSLQVEYVATGPAVLETIINDPKTLAFSDFIEYYFAIKKRMPVRSHLSSSVLPHEDLGYVMPLNSDWQDVFNEFLNEEYTQSIAYKKIVNDNLGASFVKFIEKI